MVVRTVASIATGFAVWGFAHVVGLELAAALGVLSFALNYLPYVGALAAIVFPTLFAFVQFDSGEIVIFVLIGLMVIRFVIGSLIEPIFSGSALAISPPVVVFAIVLWTFCGASRHLYWRALGNRLSNSLRTVPVKSLDHNHVVG